MRRLEEKIKKELAFLDRPEIKELVSYGLTVSTALTIILPGRGKYGVIKEVARKTMKTLVATRVYQNRKPLVEYFKKIKKEFKEATKN